MDDAACALTMRGISIAFPGVQALDGVDFGIRAGEVRAIVGANGAGKSTLMKVLAGAYSHYTGEISIDGRIVDIRNPRQAKDFGIEIVYQEVDVALFPYLSVAENIMFNNLVTGMRGRVAVDWGKIKRSAREILDRLRMDVDVSREVSSLSLAQKQMVLIARAVREKCRFLVLDEPTAPLSMGEVDELFRVVKDLAGQGVSIIFISHRLPELFRICDSMTVMKDGRVVASRTVDASLTTREIVSLMLGRNLEENCSKAKREIGDVALEVEGLADHRGKVNGVTFDIRMGEIVGVSGLVGAGKTELCKLIFGAERARAGTVRRAGGRLRVSDPTSAVRQRIALVPEERRKEGVLVSEPVFFNLSAASLGKFTNALSFIRRRAELANAKKYVSELGIKTPSVFQKVKYLSGGNQQKVVVGKWLASDSDVYLFDEPTKGIDVGAKRDIYELIQSLAARGKAILYATSEIYEILAITDRTFVMYDGRFVAELETAKTDEKEILFYAAGGGTK